MPPSKTKVACKWCHLRRVRCDRTQETPCSRCRSTGQECEPIVSKRGKHKREPLRRSGFRHSFGPLPGNPESNTEATSLPTPGTFESEGSARESTTPYPPRSDTTESHSGRTIYYGDYFNLEYTRRELDESHEDYNPRMSNTRLAHVDRLGSATRQFVDNYFRRERARLDELGAFDTLNRSAREKLLRTFFEMINPVVPIIDRKDFLSKLEIGHASQLLLQAMYMVAFLHCDGSIVADAGFGNRYMAVFTCYHRAKALYDAGYEMDAVAVIQALLCLSFWWETPTQQKDMWYWTGISVGLAQSLGMHQEKTYLSLDQRKSKIWRRLWWAIYCHDISVAVQLGRIPHVNDAYCTARLLREQDFDDDDDDAPESFGGNATKETRLEPVYLADLCLRVSSCYRSLYTGNSDPSTILGNMGSLAEWKASLPVELQCRTTLTLQNGLFATMLNLTYFCFEIILRRNHFRNPEMMTPRTPVFEAAVEIVRILENILTAELITTCPLRLLPPTFAALSVLILNMRRPASEINEVSKHRARLCMLVLSKLVDHWPPGLLYYRLFARILAARGCDVPDEPAPPAGINEQQTQSHPTAVNGDYNFPITSDFVMSDTMPGEDELIGMNSLFPFSAFLNEEFVDNDLNLIRPANNNSLHP
ncbi:fungal-specific transcription factor domain-containing protein [Aspergillus spinulosporus]